MIVPKAALTRSGRPSLAAGEVERVLLDKVDLEFEGIGGTEGCQTAERYQGGYAVVTSQRLIWVDAVAAPRAGRSCALPLAALHSSTKRVAYGLNLMNPKVRLELQVFVDARSQPSSMQGSIAFRILHLRCRGESPDAFHEQLQAALAAHRQLLEQQAATAAQQATTAAQQQAGGAALGLTQPSLQQQWPGSQQQQIPWGGHPSHGSQQLPGGVGALHGRAQPPGGAAVPPAPAISAVDQALLDALLEMGFPRPRVLRALVATHSEHLQAALDWILAAGEDASMDAPLSGPEPVAVSRQELQQLQHLNTLQQQPLPQQQQRQPQPGWGVGSVGAAAAYGSGSSWGSTAGSQLRPGPGGAGAPPPPQPSLQQHGAGAAAPLVGVAGIMSREAERSSQASAHLTAAFRDLDALMAMAADMVKLAEKFRGVMGPHGTIAMQPQLQQQQPGGGGDSGEVPLLDAEAQLQLIALGITSPVTKASAGARYTQELSRQLADFLDAPLCRAGGVMMLPDVYCLFNRARGTELVSPDDLMAACEAFPQVGVPLRLRRFASGVIVVQGAAFSDKQLCVRIQQLLAEKQQQQQQQQQGAPALGPPLSAGDVSAALALPLTLAGEALLVAEAAGVLCRDDGPEGLRFFANFFKDAVPLVVN